MKIREAVPEDAEAVCLLWEELMDFHAEYDVLYERTPKGVGIFREFFDETIEIEKGIVLVAEDQGKILGYLLGRIEEKLEIYVHADYGMIYDLSVTKSAQRQGVGEALFKASVDWFKSKGTPRIELNVASANPISTKFWEKQGLKTAYECRFTNI